ncbi:MAG: pitrilysin family protein [Nitrospirota bacterium]
MFLLKKNLAAVIIVLITIILSSQPAFAKKVEEFVLSNGLKIIAMEEHKAPTVTFQVWYKVGSRNEATGKTGLSHLLEHLMFKGTQKYGKGEFSKIVAKNGGNENAFTSRDYTAYFEVFSSDRIHLSLELESDRMTNLLIDEKEFQLERNVVKEERRMRTDDEPTSLVVEELYAMAFKVHPYHSPIIGWMSDLDTLARDDLYNHYKKYYMPNNATIVVVGDFDTKTLIPKIKEHFEKIPKGEAPAKINIKEPEQLGERRTTLHKEAQLPFVFIGYHTPNIGNKDEFALEVVSNILSAGKSSRLYQDIVYEKQLALYAGGDYGRIAADPSLFYFYGGLKPGKTTKELEDALYAEIEKLKTEPVTDRELQKSKNQVEASFIFAQDSIFYQAMQIGQIETIGIGYKYLDAYVDNIRRVTKDDIMRVAKTYFTEKNRTVGILIPVKQNGKGQ